MAIDSTGGVSERVPMEGTGEEGAGDVGATEATEKARNKASGLPIMDKVATDEPRGGGGKGKKEPGGKREELEEGDLPPMEEPELTTDVGSLLRDD